MTLIIQIIPIVGLQPKVDAGDTIRRLVHSCILLSKMVIIGTNV
jgi:hypothetical protein